MKLAETLVPGQLIQRYKRFLADIRLDNGELVVAHCANTGAMTGCAVPGSRVWLSRSDNPRRKLAYSWELVECQVSGLNKKSLACVNTAVANKVVAEALAAGVMDELSGYGLVRAEVPYGAEKSRVDFLLQGHVEGKADCYVEVKSVTLCGASGQGSFPDAVSVRGQKHLRELATMVAKGYRAVLLFCVNHTGIQSVQPAAHIDPVYADILADVQAAGVEVYAWGTQICPEKATIDLVHALPFYSTATKTC